MDWQGELVTLDNHRTLLLGDYSCMNRILESWLPSICSFFDFHTALFVCGLVLGKDESER